MVTVVAPPVMDVNHQTNQAESPKKDENQAATPALPDLSDPSGLPTDLDELLKLTGRLVSRNTVLVTNLAHSDTQLTKEVKDKEALVAKVREARERIRAMSANIRKVLEG